MLKVKGLSKAFGKYQAVDQVSFKVRKGETFAFLGTNGAGKTTVIYMLMGLLKKDAGSIKFAEHEVIGVVFQSHRLDEALTVEENIYLRAKLSGMKRAAIKKRLDELLKVLSLTHARHRKYGVCSGGEKRKADIIRALMHEPSFLILDEPTTGLDAKSRAEIWSFLKILQVKEGLTIFLTTHYIEEAEDANNVLIMNRGRVRVKGTPDELRDRYAKPSLELQVDKTERVIENLQANHCKYELKNDAIVIPLQSKLKAIPILHDNHNWIIDYKIQETSLERVFLKIKEVESL